MMRELQKISIEKVLSWRPCNDYDGKRLKELFAGRESIDALEILDLDISISDRFWAVFHKEVLPDAVFHEAACRFAEQAFYKIKAINIQPDPRSIAAVEAKRKWLKSEISDKELLVVKVAARDAAWAASAAARAAAWAASDAALAVSAAAWAASDAALAVSVSAAAVAASAATWAASAAVVAASAASEEQIEILKDLINEWRNS